GLAHYRARCVFLVGFVGNVLYALASSNAKFCPAERIVFPRFPRVLESRALPGDLGSAESPGAGKARKVHAGLPKSSAACGSQRQLTFSVSSLYARFSLEAETVFSLCLNQFALVGKTLAEVQSTSVV